MRLLHAAYRVLAAINAIVERERMHQVQRDGVQKLLRSYQQKAVINQDGPLEALVMLTKHRLKNLT